MEMNFRLAASLGFVSVVLYLVYRILDWVWFRPKRLEKCLREQGFKGNPYRLLIGDQVESGNLMKEALSKPLRPGDDIKKRVMPHVLKTMEVHGKNSFIWVGRTPRVQITEPELIKEVLTNHIKFRKDHHDLPPLAKKLLTGVFTLEGEPWAKRRRILNSSFHFEKLKLMLSPFHLSTCELLSKWDKQVPDGGSAEVDVWPDFTQLTADIVSRTLFGSNYEEGRIIFELLRELHIRTVDLMRSVYIPGQRFLPTERNNEIRAIDKEVRNRTKEIVIRRMKKMKAGEAAGNDFLGILLECNQNEIREQGNNKNAGMSIEQIVGECRLFYFAGQETTATFLAWTFLFLSRYPDWQTRAREEVFQVFGEKTPDYNGLNNLKIMSMIFHEVLRLHPPAVEVTKVVQEDTQLGEYFIPAGVQIQASQILVHHDPEIWGEDAMEFKPERFSEGVLKATKNQLGSYFPFSLGPRICIGQNFSLLEAKMILALILRRFWFELSPSYVHAPFTLITLQPQYGAHLILHKL